MEKIMISEARYGRGANHLENNEFIDRLNSRYTVMFLMLSIAIIIGKIYIASSIYCWTPAQFTGPHNEYTHTICWLKGSYYLPTDNITIPDRSQPRIHYVSYYQWTPFILLLMGIFFILSKILWDGVTRQVGIDIRPIVNSLKTGDQEKGIEATAIKLRDFLHAKKTVRGICCCNPIRMFGNSSLTIVYGCVKIYQVVNVLVQWILLHAFLAFSFTRFGYEAFVNFFGTTNWFESPRFPRVTMCDFMIRHLGSNQHWYAVQCSLPINIYNEKIFFILWIWLIILFFLNIISLITWLVSLSGSRQTQTIRKYLLEEDGRKRFPRKSSRSRKLSNSSHDMPDDHSIYEFIKFLGKDGVILLRIISYNTNIILASRIASKLYEKLNLTNKYISSVPNDSTNRHNSRGNRRDSSEFTVPMAAQTEVRERNENRPNGRINYRTVEQDENQQYEVDLRRFDTTNSPLINPSDHQPPSRTIDGHDQRNSHRVHHENDEV